VTFDTALQLISTLTLLFGVCFGLLQLRLNRAQSERDSALELLRSFQTPEFAHALLLIFALPDDLPKAQIEERLGSDVPTVYALLTTWESLGILVFREEVSLALVDDFFSGPILLSWRKLRRYVEEQRQEQGRETIEEWFQWLAERMEERESRQRPIPAHVMHKNWRSRR
jgi:hypothetical protein